MKLGHDEEWLASTVGELGDSLSAQTGYNRTAQVEYDIYYHTRYICGQSDPPGETPRQLVARTTG